MFIKHSNNSGQFLTHLDLIPVLETSHLYICWKNLSFSLFSLFFPFFFWVKSVVDRLFLSSSIDWSWFAIANLIISSHLRFAFSQCCLDPECSQLLWIKMYHLNLSAACGHILAKKANRMSLILVPHLFVIFQMQLGHHFLPSDQFR